MTRTFGKPLKAAALAALLATPVASPALMAQGVSIGDLDGYADYYADETGEAPVTPAAPAAPPAAAQSNLGRPMYDEAVEAVAYVGDQGIEPAGHMAMNACSDCGTSDCGCGSAPMTHHRMARACRPANRMNGWLTAEALLWFPQDRRLPPLVTQSAAGTDPILGAGTNVVFGGNGDGFGQAGGVGERIDAGLSGGFRLDGGVYVTEDIGIGGRYWTIDDAEVNFNRASNGTQFSLGRPFFDAGQVNGQNALLVGFNDGIGNGTTDFTGSINATTNLDIYGAEAYARIKLLSGNCFRTELIGGYSNFGIDDTLRMTSISTAQSTDPSPNLTIPNIGETITITDQITAENNFNGGQFGLNTSVTRGRWGFHALTKMHLGNMEQTYGAVGQTTFTTLPPTVPQVDPAVVIDSGVLNLGFGNREVSRDVFTFAPEANMKLAYRFRPNVSLSVGYSFLYWSRVLMVEDNLSTTYNLDTAGGVLIPGNVAPTLVPQDRGFWVQGVDLGAIIEF